MMQSENIKTLLEGMVKAQAEFPTLPKDKEGYGYKYTDLDTVISTVRPILAKYNIGFMQMLSTLEGNVKAITTRIYNNNGEWIEDTTPLPDVAMAKTNAAQNLGAAITYMKRYALCAMLGISSDEDADGNIELNARPQTRPQTRPQQNKTTGPKGGADTPAEKAEIEKLLSATYSDGTLIFDKAYCAGIGKMRMQFTAAEVIQKIKAESVSRIQAKGNSMPKQEEFPEDIPFDIV